MGETQHKATQRAGLPDDFVIDITDDHLALMADETTVIDIRDDVVAKTGGAIVTSKSRPASGRPLDLAPGLELVVLKDEDERWEKAERFVYDTYCEMGYCRPSDRKRVEELQAWNGRSTFHVVFDEDEQVVGTSRHIAGGFSQLPVGQFNRVDFTDPDPVSELSSLAVAPTARGLSVVVHLCRSVFVEAWTNGAGALMFLIDDWMVELLADSYALPIRFIAEQKFYMGGHVSPSAMTFQGPEFLVTARHNPHYWNWMTEAFTPQQVADWNLPIVLVDEPELAPTKIVDPARA